MTSAGSQGRKLRRNFVIAGLATSLLSGCATGVCTGWKPVTVSNEDNFSEETAKNILGHNEYGAKLGCSAFKPKGGGGFLSGVF